MKIIRSIENSNVQNEKVIDPTGEIKLAIDYTKTVKKSISDGKYDLKNSAITPKNFPVSLKMIGKKVEVSVKLFHFDRGINCLDAISEMDKAGYRPATLMELLALGSLYPELQRRFSIIALGSVWSDEHGRNFVPLLQMFGSKRHLELIWNGCVWTIHYCFLGVCK